MAYHYTLIRERDRPVLQGVLAQQLGGAAIFAGWVADYLLR
jgi:hypothetical protein